jgi:hypothetical protein
VAAARPNTRVLRPFHPCGRVVQAGDDPIDVRQVDLPIRGALEDTDARPFRDHLDRCGGPLNR